MSQGGFGRGGRGALLQEGFREAQRRPGTDNSDESNSATRSYPWLPTPREDCIGLVRNYSDRSTLGHVIANAAINATSQRDAPLASMAPIPTTGRGRSAIFEMISKQMEGGNGALPRLIGRGRSISDLPLPADLSLPLGRGRSMLLPHPQVDQAAGGDQGAIGGMPRPIGRGRSAQLQGLVGETAAPAFLVPQALQPTVPVSSGLQRVSPPQRISPPPSTAVEKRMEQMSLEEKEPVIRRGESGVVLNCSANYISLILEPGKGVYEYEVKFAPEVDAMNIKFQLISSLFGKKRTFDGTTLYLPQKLDEEIKIYNETTKTGLQVTITIIYKRQKRLGECVHLYNVLFKRIMVVLDLIRHGRNHYNPREAQVIPQYKLEVWPGYVTAVDEYEGGIQLCFDASHRVLRTQTVLDTMREYVSKYPTNFKDELFKAVIGQSVLTRYNNKLYRVDDVMWNKTPGDTFEKHGKLTREQIVCLVPEFCFLTGLTDSMRNDYQLMKSIAMYTRITPNQRQMALQKFINNVNQSQEASQLLLDWGLKLSPTTVKLEGRTLNPEAIMFGKNGKFPGSSQADWGSQCTRNQVLVAVNLNNWVVVYVPKDQRVSNDFVSTMKRVGPQMGIMVSDANMVPLRDDRVETFLRALRESITPSTQIVVIICPSARTDRYSAIKKLCCVEKPIASQVRIKTFVQSRDSSYPKVLLIIILKKIVFKVINSRTIMKQDKIRSVTQKICLQMNCKLGGSLWRVQIPFKNVMVCGVDSYHDAEYKGKSWAGFVASLDGDMTKWYSRVAIQLPSQELLDTLVAMLINAIHRYKEVRKS
uniref:Piwi domain-containing protein n=1 Tax=Timema poppense TaxID=170557 RepID=A0A7R9CUR4_TIMPO|nr:unnamed protein product [Timema poppensis]